MSPVGFGVMSGICFGLATSIVAGSLAVGIFVAAGVIAALGCFDMMRTP